MILMRCLGNQATNHKIIGQDVYLDDSTILEKQLETAH